MPTILVTNDDGVQSEGIAALAEALMALGDVTVVAPKNEASAIGHALTLRRPLRINRIAAGWFGVDGTPTDCVNIAISQILKKLPDLVVSGINKGWNLGDDVTYSGTVAGALEGIMLGVPSLAISQERTAAFDFSQAADTATRFAEQVLTQGLPDRTFLNINVPGRPARGVKVTVQARRNHQTAVSEAFDPRRDPYYWIEEAQLEWEPHDLSDYQALRDGWISVTPLQTDWTNHEALSKIARLVRDAETPAGEPRAAREPDDAVTIRGTGPERG